jgi:hypothetical protein
MDAINRQFGDSLSEDELRTLADLCNRLRPELDQA